MAKLNPYLNFGGNTEEAFNFYKSVFGGEFNFVQRFKDVPAEVAQPGVNPNDIMHIALPIGGGTILMGSDKPSSFGPVSKGDNFYISIDAESEKEAEKLFNGLSSGGNVIMPLDKAFWGAYFGMLVDKYGVQWMVNYDYPQDK